MFGKVKKILGIEGAKVELIVPPKINKEVGVLSGYIKITSLSDNNIVESIQVKMVEKYTRGRGDSKLIDEYTMGTLEMKERIVVSKNDIVEVPFEMDFVFVQSEMDKLGDSNFLTRGLVSLAKKARGVQSEFGVHVEVKVKGTTLNPIDSKPIILE
ncbi:MAG: sporulation protein [Saprospiraceae bacterium]